MTNSDTPSVSTSIQVDLSGQTAIVTGASRGLGRTIAIALARNGARVACVARSAEKLQATVDEITSFGGVAASHVCDVSHSDSVNALVDAVAEKWERLHILVNNAGVTADTLALRMSDEQWDTVIATNLRGPFLFLRAASRLMMQARYGRVVNIASVSGMMGNPGQANYSASKAGLIGMTKTVARELATRKVTVNCVSPGFIETEMTEKLGPAILDAVKDRIPAKRLGMANEVADAVLYLVSSGAAYVTGQVIVVDGGMIA